MRKMTFLACAAMLTSAFVLSSCNQNEQNVPTQKMPEVKTEFAITLPDNAVGGPRKMPSTTVQRDGVSQFQGITTIALVPFAKAGEITKTDVRLGKNINLNGNVVQADVDKASKAKVYEDVSIPLTTASFLFYGKSAAVGTGTDQEKKFQVGSLIADTASAKEPAAFSFSLDPVYSSYAATVDDGGHGYALMAYLTSVATVSDGNATNPRRWYQYPEVGDSVAMSKMFQTFTSMKGLSSFEVSRVLTDLYKSLKPLNTEIATAIKAAINNATYATIDGNDTVRLKSPYNNYPTEYGLPVGCVAMKWDDSSKKFVAQNTAGYTSLNMATPDHFVYPAQLWYFANSQIKTSKSSKKAMYASSSWEDILAAHTDGNAVNTLTRAVALNDSVQYAVGRFDVKVCLKDTVKLADNSFAVEGIKTDVDYGSGFPVTAIFVGGQKNVGFDFTPATIAVASDEYTIYDNVMTSTQETPTPADMIAVRHTGADVYSAVNHTLVLETAQDAIVRIAVEMLNNTGKDFYGASGQLIPKNGKFYVVAQLDPTSSTVTGKRVFKQDYTTTAKLTLNNLKKAYNTIPDLRTPQLEIGFSVDLSWKTGFEYTVDFE